MTRRRKPTYKQIELAARVAHEAQFIVRGDAYATESEMNMHRNDPLACDDLVWHIIGPSFGMTAEDIKHHTHKVWKPRI